MDTKMKKCCPNCSQPFALKTSPQQKGRMPLLLKCGHSVCESCILNMLKFSEPIECKICSCPMELSPGDLMLLRTNLYAIFPENVYAIGELAIEMMKGNCANNTSDAEFYLDLKGLLSSIEFKQEKCEECQRDTSKMCKQCSTVLCEPCFHKMHKFHVFKNHELKCIETKLEDSFCKVHKDKKLDYYCKDCDKSICMNCMIVGGEKSCKNHNVIERQEMNESVYEEICTVAPKVDEQYRRLTKTAVDIGHLLKGLSECSTSTDLDSITNDVENYFSALIATVQLHHQEVYDELFTMKTSEKHSLEQAKGVVSDSIKRAKSVYDKLQMASDLQNLAKANLPALLAEAKELINGPWYLKQNVKKEENIDIKVEKDLIEQVSKFIRVEGSSNLGYSLLSTSDIETDLPPPPPRPVYPPETVRDVRETPKQHNHCKLKTPELYNSKGFMEKAPKYRSKYGSNSSISSYGSETSHIRPASSAYGSSVCSNVPINSVPPVPNANHPKPLNEGSLELIYISHIVSPHSFYVQRACHQLVLKEMIKEFKGAASHPTPTVNFITEGKVFLGYNKIEKEWQRCRIVSIKKDKSKGPLYEISWIDFGSMDLIDIKSLRLLPAPRLQSPPPLALRCALFNCTPRAPQWTHDDSLLMHKIIDNKQSVMHVRRVCSSVNYNVSLECDITTYEEGTNLVYALVFHERADMPNPNLVYPRINGNVDKTQIIFNNTDYKAKMVEQVVISYAYSPNQFYVRKLSQQVTYEKLLEEMEQKYSTDTDQLVYYPIVGVSYAVLSEGSWQRGVMCAGVSGRRVRLLLADVGREVTAHYSALRALLPAHARIKALATRCYLSGLRPLRRVWPEEARAVLQRAAGRALELHVDESPSAPTGPAGVTLYDKADSDRVVCINADMISAGYAISSGVYTFNQQKKELQANKQKKNRENVHKKKAAKRVENQITILKREKSPEPAAEEEELEAENRGPIKLEVKVLACESPSRVYVALVDQEPTFEELYDALQEHFHASEETARDWRVGDKCVALSQISKTWRRAVIQRVDGDSARLFYSDFALTESLSLSLLRELPPRFASVGEAALKCHLSGMMPALGDDWPSITKEYLAELLERYPRIFITKNGAIKDDSLPVELWAYHIIPGDALEPNRSEWRCLNAIVIDQGLAIPDKSQQTSTSQYNCEGEEMISFLNMKGLVTDWLHDEEEKDKDKGEEKAEGEGWLPPDAPESKVFTGVATNVDGEGVLYIHDLSSENTREMIHQALSMRFKGEDPRAAAAVWAPRQPCVARYYLDHHFYRGLVLAVDDDAKKCLVRYVDFGNEEHCDFRDMRHDIILQNIPLQTRPYVLGRIRPAKGVWDKDSLDFIHKMVVEKRCTVTILDDEPAERLIVDLKIDKIVINDFLVELGLASYADAPSLDEPADPSPDVADPPPEPAVDPATQDWNLLMAQEADDSLDSDAEPLTYPRNHIGKEFMCSVSFIDGVDVELTLVQNDETNLLYKELYEELQRLGGEQPALGGAAGGAAAGGVCLARYSQDGRWYRARVLGVLPRGLLVHYVDFGNREAVSAADVRELRAEWASLPPAAVPARLAGVRPTLAPPADLRQRCEETFLTDKFVRAEVLDDEPARLLVRLYGEDDQLVYADFIRDHIFLPLDDETEDN